MDILEAKGVSYHNFVKYPDLSIRESLTTFIQGPSGSGKTTLLKLFNATLSPSLGELFYKGKPFSSLDPVSLRREVLLMGQSVFLFRGSIKSNFAQYYDSRDLSCISTEEIEAFSRLCCLDFAPDNVCDNMSGGERQRVYLSIFLSLAPKVLMLDEPTSALDKATAKQLMCNLKAHCKNKGITLVVISHDPTLANEFADCIINVQRGQNS